MSRCSIKRRQIVRQTNTGLSLPTGNVWEEENFSSDDVDETADLNLSCENRADGLILDSDDDLEEESFRALYSLDGTELHDDFTEIQLQESNVVSIDGVPQIAEVSENQRQAAHFIANSSKSSRGLSIKKTDLYLKTLPLGAEATQIWPSGNAFWDDHAKRQKAMFSVSGEWKKVAMHSFDHSASYSVPNYFALVRDLTATNEHVVESAKHLKLEKGQTWSHCIKLNPIIEFDAFGDRIVHD